MRIQFRHFVLLAGLFVVTAGCGDGGTANITEGVEQSEIEKYEAMLAQEEKDANATMAESADMTE